jgi:heat shock protein HslJ
MKKGILFVLSMVMVSSVLGGCIGQVPLEGTLWNLDSYMNDRGELVSVLPATEVTAQFQDGRVGGSAGCNSYFGSYHVNGNTITIGPLSSTLMFCGEPEGLMKQETNYLAALRSATHYEITGSKLEMTNTDGVLILVFTAA